MTERTSRDVYEWPAWFEGAPCAGLSDVFFPEDPLDTGPARRVCGSCPFQPACKAWGVAHVGRQWDGIYGGLTLRERRFEARFGTAEREECPKGHRYTTANTTWDSSGHRRCVECRRQWNSRSHVRRHRKVVS